MKTSVVNIHKTKRYDIYIGRPGPFGNPFIIMRDGNRNEVLEKYYKWLPQQKRLLQKMRRELKGKVLG